MISPRSELQQSSCLLLRAPGGFFGACFGSLRWKCTRSSRRTSSVRPRQRRRRHRARHRQEAKRRRCSTIPSRQPSRKASGPAVFTCCRDPQRCTGDLAEYTGAHTLLVLRANHGVLSVRRSQSAVCGSVIMRPHAVPCLRGACCSWGWAGRVGAPGSGGDGAGGVL